jgi:hypothetical protein
MPIEIGGSTIIGDSRDLTSYREKITTVGTVSSSTYNIDLNLSNIFHITLGTNVTFTFTNPAASGTLVSATIILRQDATGNRTATFTNARYTDGILPLLTTTGSAVDVLSFFTIDGGANYFGSFVMADVK